jgi:predicted alpha-1,2-mannosidase
MRRLALVVALLAVLAPGVRAPAEVPDLAQYVDPMVGTAAPGFVFPGPAMPFGMVQNSPDTTGEFAYSGYLWTDPVIRGFSLVHLNGPGVHKAGDVPFMPSVGPLPSSADPNLYASTFDHASETASPGYYSVQLLGAATKVELSAAMHVGMQRYTFPPTAQANVLLDVARSGEGAHDGHVDLDPATNEVSGWSAGRYRVYFAGRFDRAWTAAVPWGSGDKGTAFTFDTSSGSPAVTLRVGVSFVDVDGARRNLEADAPDFDFAGMVGRARSAWNEALSSVLVEGGTPLDTKELYTSLYHAMQHPNVFEDVDRRYRGFDNAVHVATDHVHYANFSSWDTYKAQNQLLATVAPDRYRDMVLSLLDAYRESGKLPRWGEQNFDAAHMSGDPAIPMIADAACRGLLDEVPSAMAELYKGALDLVARRPAELASLGYLAGRPGTTLEYGVGDFALALLAQRVGDVEGAQAALDRSHNWRNILDPETKWVRPRNADGSWKTPFLPNDEDGFQEGNSWQYSWLAPHDSAAVYEAMGGESVAVSRLDQLFAAPAEAQTRATAFGVVYRVPQYAPGNEHDLQVPWMYPFAGQQWRTADELRNVQQVFRPTIDGLPGNDDLGSLSAWQAWSVLGFGPVTPGAPFFVVGSPTFTSVSLRLGSNVHAPRFTVSAVGASVAARYVQSATLNDKPLTASWFKAASVRPGGSLRLEMGALPNTSYGAGVADRPPSSASTVGDLNSFACSE